MCAHFYKSRLHTHEVRDIRTSKEIQNAWQDDDNIIVLGMNVQLPIFFS